MANEMNPSAYLAALHCAEDELTEVDQRYRGLCVRKEQIEQLVHELELLAQDAGPIGPRREEPQRVAPQVTQLPAAEPSPRRAEEPGNGPSAPDSVSVVDTVPSDFKPPESVWPRAFLRQQMKRQA